MWLLAASLCAHADPQSDLAEEADILFRLGVRDYGAGLLEDALEHMLASHRLVPNRNVQFNIARCFEELGMLDEAWRHYDEYARAEPDPQARAEAESALLRLGAKVARVEITSDPPGATVYADRTDLGARGLTPLTLALPPGKHPIVLDLPGYSRAERTAELVVGQRAATRIQLVPVKVESEPAPPPPPPPPPWSATVRSGGEVLVRVDETSCALLPARVEGAGRPRAATLPPQAPRGSALASRDAIPGLGLDVVWLGAATWTALPRLEKHSTILADVSTLRAFVFDRCEPTDPGGLARAAAALPEPIRMDLVAVWSEWAAVRGAKEIDATGPTCMAGNCAPLVERLLKP